MKFFETVHGALYPISQITAIRRGKWTNSNSAMRDDGQIDVAGRSAPVTVSDDEIDRLLRVGDPVVQAFPGFTVLASYYNNEDDTEPYFVEEMPVVAWRVDENGQPRPVVADFGFDGLTIAHGVLRPDGTVIDLHGTTYRARPEWEASTRAWLQEAATRENARREQSARPAQAQ